MAVLTLDHIRSLAAKAPSIAISIFAPTHGPGPEVRGDTVRLKNLLTDAERRAESLTGYDRGKLRQRFEELRSAVADGWFRFNQSGGLAIFMGPERIRVRQVPVSFEELVTAGSMFQVTPLIGAVENGSDFYVLALSLNRVRLMHGTRFGLNEIALRQAPEGLMDLGYDDDTSEQLQLHSLSTPGVPEQSAIFHGQGGSERPESERILHYLREIEANVWRILRGSAAPLILAADVTLVPQYQGVSRYQHLVREAVIGNPDMASLLELHRKAWPIVAERLDDVQRRIVARMAEAIAAEKGVTSVEQVVREAWAGRVKTLLVPDRQQVWGRWVATTEGVEVHDGRQVDSEDLLNVAAIQTLNRGGTVAVVDGDSMPDGVPAAAELRYEIG